MNLLALQGAPTEHLGSGEIATRFGVVLFLVALNAFFVAAEFSLVAVRRSRIDEMAENGDTGARNVQRALEHLDRYIAEPSSESPSHRLRLDGLGSRQLP
jgi:hypothetical protein